jgi:ribosomal protein S3
MRIETTAKSLRRTVAAIAEHDVDGVACVVQGRLDGSAIAEAGLSAMPKTPKPTKSTNDQEG